MAVSKNYLMTEAGHFLLDMQSNQQRYLDFLSTMAKYHKYGLTQQINLFFHAPASSTGAVATKELWAKLGKNIPETAEPIPILTGEQYQEHVEEVYDLSETEGYQGERMTWAYEEDKCRAFMDEHFPGPAELSMPQRIVNQTRIYVNALPWVENKELAALSTAYVVMQRLGYDAEEELGLEMMMLPWDGVKVEEVLGAVNEASKVFLNPLGDYIRKEERNEHLERVRGASGKDGDLGELRGADEEAGRGGKADGSSPRHDGGDGRPGNGEMGVDATELHDNHRTEAVDGRVSGEGESAGLSGQPAGGVRSEVRTDEEGTVRDSGSEHGASAEGLAEVRTTEAAGGHGADGVPGEGDQSVLTEGEAQQDLPALPAFEFAMVPTGTQEEASRKLALDFIKAVQENVRAGHHSMVAGNSWLDSMMSSYNRRAAVTNANESRIVEQAVAAAKADMRLHAPQVAEFFAPYYGHNFNSGDQDFRIEWEDDEMAIKIGDGNPIKLTGEEILAQLVAGQGLTQAFFQQRQLLSAEADKAAEQYVALEAEVRQFIDEATGLSSEEISNIYRERAEEAPEALPRTEDEPSTKVDEDDVVIGYPAPSKEEHAKANKIISGRVKDSEFMECAIAALHVDRYRWHEIEQFGGGLFETDGQALNLKRNHISYTLRLIEERGLTLPEDEVEPLPPVYPDNYMKLGTRDYERRTKLMSQEVFKHLIHELPAGFPNAEVETEAVEEEDVQAEERSALEEAGTDSLAAVVDAELPLDSGEIVSGETEVIDSEQTETVEPEPVETLDYSGLDFEADMSTTSGKRKVFERNLAAIRTMKLLEKQGREATPEEQRVLRSYAGFGGISEAFDKFNTAWETEYHELLDTLTDSEFTAARGSTLNAHFTPPEYIQGIYEGLLDMGFTGGNVLEPSCGSGRFFCNMPQAMAVNSRLYGVELDPLTARIAAKAYPEAKVAQQPFERTNFADSSFDLAISNVPFGDYPVVSDTRYRGQRLMVHDYFISKMVDEVRPGGLVVAMTSSGTMDKQSMKARLDIAKKAELVGAVRLPRGAFSAAGAPAVTTDILVFKKRQQPLADEKAAYNDQNAAAWLTSDQLNYEFNNKHLNHYFNAMQKKQGPARVLGNLALASGPHGQVLTCLPQEGQDLKAGIAAALKDSCRLYRESKRMAEGEPLYKSTAEPMPEPAQEEMLSDGHYGFFYQDGHVVMHEIDGTELPFDAWLHREAYRSAVLSQQKDSKLTEERRHPLSEAELTAGRQEKLERIDKKALGLERKMLSLMKVRDVSQEVIDAQSRNCTDEELAALQKDLNHLYDEHVRLYGHFCDDKELMRYFRNDPACPLVEALEIIDEESKKFKEKADIFFKRTIQPHLAPTEAKTATDALAFSLQEKGKVDLDYMTGLMQDKTKEDLLHELEFTSVYHDLATDTYQTADEYLSGNVRAKINDMEMRREALRRELSLALADAMHPGWQLAGFEPKNEWEQRMQAVLMEHKDFVRGQVPAISLDSLETYELRHASEADKAYYDEHIRNDREFALRMAACSRDIRQTPQLSAEFIEDPLFCLEAFRYGCQLSSTGGGYAIREALQKMGMTEKELNKHPFLLTPERIAAYEYLHEKFSAAGDYKNLDWNERRAFAEKLGEEWPAYKEAYDNRVEAFKNNRESAEVNSCLDRLDVVEKNLAALEEVKPPDVSFEDIKVTLGTSWIPTNYIEDFLVDELDLSYHAAGKIQVKYSDTAGEWKIEHKGDIDYNVKNIETYGTPHKSALVLIEDALNLRQTHVYKDDPDGKRVIDPKETSLAQFKQAELKKDFTEWLMRDKNRAERVAAYYNDHFNAFVPREYNGDFLNFPGMNPAVMLQPHQKTAIARTIYGGNTLFAHAVGGGKTYEMIGSAMESKRLGICHKSLIVVPKHLTEQTGASFMNLYPGAKILVAQEEDFKKENRKAFAAKVATGNWDAVIMGYTQFERIPITPERQEAIYSERIMAIEDKIEEMKESGVSGRDFSVKAAESAKKKLIARLDKIRGQLEEKKDDTPIYFEHLGIDRLYVDEAHNFKNRYILTKMSNIPGVSTSNSERANDLYDKVQYINEKTNYKGVVFATGTPVSNSMTELYTMQSYLQPQRLEEAGLDNFDDWASTFGETKTGFELTPEGKGFREKTRFSKFHNLPELMTMFKEAADVKTADMMNLERPDCEQLVEEIEPTQAQKNMVDNLAARAMAVRQGGVDPHVDNMLRITNEGRMLALDERIIDPTLPDNPDSKVNRCVKNVLDIYRANMETKSTQIIFCDKSVPDKKHPNKFNVYDDIREKLVAQGVPREEIAFIQEAKDDEAKEELFAKVRAGKVRVLLGGTDNLGVGTNVQDRLIATHDLDIPWRPADLEQRKGRIERRGNTNDRVKVIRYVTKGTFDAYMWQLIENKSRFIAQIMTSKAPSREMEDCDEVTLTAAEIKALATGDPLIKEKMEVDNDLNRLKQAREQYIKSQAHNRKIVEEEFPNRIAHCQEFTENLLKNKELWEENTRMYKDDNGVEQEEFSIVINGKKYLDRKEAAEVLQKAVTSEKLSNLHGEYKGFRLSATMDWQTKAPHLNLMHNTTYQIAIYGKGERLLNAVMNVGQKIDKEIIEQQEHLEELKHNLEVAKKEAGQPFAQEEEFKRLTARSKEIDYTLKAKDKGLETDEEIQADVRISQLGDYLSSDGQVNFLALPPNDAEHGTERKYLYEAVSRLANDNTSYEAGNRLTTEKEIAQTLLSQGHSIDKIAAAAEKYSPCMLSLDELKRLVEASKMPGQQANMQEDELHQGGCR